MLAIVMDLLLLVIIALCVRRGWHKGLILSISGIIAIIIAFYGAAFVAEKYSEEFTPMVEPFVSGLVDKSVTQTLEDYDKRGGVPAGQSEIDTVGLKSVENLGVFKNTAQKMIADIKKTITDVGQNFKNAVVTKVSSSLTYILTFIVVLILIMIIFSVAANLLNLAFKLPGLNFVNEFGGAIFGGVKGLLILFVIAWAMRYFGIVMPDAILEKTFLLKFLMGHNVLTNLIGI